MSRLLILIHSVREDGFRTSQSIINITDAPPSIGFLRHTNHVCATNDFAPSHIHQFKGLRNREREVSKSLRPSTIIGQPEPPMIGFLFLNLARASARAEDTRDSSPRGFR